MKILISMASVDPRRGGPSTAVRSLAAMLVAQGNSVTIVAHDDGSRNVVGEDAPYKIIRFPLTSSIWQFSYAYFRWIARNIDDFDAVLVHSLFLSHSWYVPFFARLRGVPYAIRPHGSLNIRDMERGALKKSLYMRLIERRNLKRSQFIFCTSEREAMEAGRFGDFRRVVIPLGVDSSVISHREPKDIDRSLVAFIGRITRKKGIEVIIESMPALLEHDPSIRVVIAGPDDEKLQSKFENLANKLGVSDSLSFTGHLGPDARNDLLSKAGVFVLPSMDENFGIGVAEAMQAGVPVVISPGVSHAPFVEEYGAGVVTSRNPDEFASGVIQVLTADGSRYERMSRSAQKIVHDKYSWRASAESLVRSFSA